METNRNTDRLFEQLREMPEEMSHAKVEQFVLAQAAIGIVPVSASKGLAGMHKLFYKFHLNTIAIMTTAATASIISVFVLATGLHKPGDKFKHHQFFKSSDKIKHHQLFDGKNHNYKNSFFHGFTFSTDTPKTVSATSNSLMTVSTGKNISVTTIKTNPGTKISITTTSDSVITKVSSDGKDSSYSYAYSNQNGNGNTSVFIFNNSDAVVASASDDLSHNLDQMNVDLGQLSDDLAKQTADLAKQSEDMAKQMADMNISGNNMAMSYAYEGSGHCAMNSDTLISKLEDALLNDKLITDAKDFTFCIDGSSLKVNGKKLEKTQWEKYKDIIETYSHSTVDKKFRYDLHIKGDSVTINVKNFAN